MYTVVSRYKQGSWQRTMLATGLLLAGCTVLARLWAGGPMPEVALDQRYASPNWPLVLYVPDGWVPRESTASSGRPIVRLSDESGTEFLHVTRRESSGYRPPETIGQMAAVQDVLSFGVEGLLSVDPPTPTPFGPLPGAIFAAYAPGGDGEGFYICAVGCSPDGAIYSAILRTSGRRLRAATRLLTRIVATAEVAEPKLRTAEAFDFSQAALQFDVPAGTRFFRVGSTDDAETVRCLSPQDSDEPWQLDVTRTWLTDGHPAALLIQHRFGFETHEVDAKVEPVALDRGTAFRIGEADPNANQAVELWAVPLGDHGAALIAAHGGPRAEATLQRICRTVAETVREGPLKSPVDVPRALRRARDVVREIRQRGLATWWGKRSTDEWYIESNSAHTIGFERSRRRPLENEPYAYELEHVEFSFGPIHDIPLRYSARWTVGADASVERGVSLLRYTLPSQPDIVYRTSETQPRGTDTRQRRRELAGRSVDDVISGGETFVGTSTMEVAWFLVASHPEMGPAVFTVSGLFDHTGDTHSVLCVPLGRRPAPEADTKSRPWRLLVRRDYSSRYEILRFDDGGSLTRQEVPPWLDVQATSRRNIETKFDVETVLKELEGLKIPDP